MRIWTTIAFLTALNLTGACAQDCPLTVAPASSGLFFTGGFIHGGSGEGGGIQPWLGAGWRFGGMWSTSVHFQTGHLIVGSAAGRPIDGNLFFGGALIQVQYEGIAHGPHPLVGVAGGLATALTRGGVGYNGAQAGIMAGIAWNLSRMLRLSLGADFTERWWINGVGDAAQGMDPFATTSAGAQLELAFFPGIHP